MSTAILLLLLLLLLMYITYKLKKLKYKSMEVQFYLLYVYETWSLEIMEGRKIAPQTSRLQKKDA